MFLRCVPSAVWLTAGLLLAGCGAPPSPQAEDPATLVRATATAVADIAVLAGTLAVPAGPADITLADVDAYERALTFRTAELRRSSDALQQARAAKDLDRELTLLLYMSSRDLDRKTAAASALDPERYAAVARILQNATARLAAAEQIDRTGDADAAVDVAARSAEPYAGFNPEVARTLQTRLPALLAHQREQTAMLLQTPG
jgi:hypothetical protein